MAETSRIEACELALDACTAARKDVEASLAKERELSQLLIKQREELVKQQPTGASIPFWVWTVVGVAGGVILTRGLR